MAPETRRPSNTAPAQPTSGGIIGERFYIYASRQPGPPEAFASIDCTPNDLPTGLIVGSAIICKCVKNCDGYEWHLTDVKRLKKPRKVNGHPPPVWFRPFS